MIPMADLPLPFSLLDGFGTVVVVVLGGWMIATGRLITRREADGIKRDRDEWKLAHGASEADRRIASEQVTQLLEHAKVTETLIRGLSQVAASREGP